MPAWQASSKGAVPPASFARGYRCSGVLADAMEERSMRKRGRSRAAPRVRGRMQMRKPMSANKAGRLVRVVVSGAMGAVLIVTLGAAAALAAGPRAGAGTVTDYQFALRGVSVLSASDAWAVGDGATVLHWDGTSWAPVTI